MDLQLADVRNYLEQMRIPLRLSCATESGWPMILSLWYLYEEGALLCATRETAKIVSFLKRDPRCAFEISGETPPYSGIRGQATASILPERGGEVLARLLVRYLGDTDKPLARRLLAHSDSEVAIKIEPVNLFTWDFTKRMKDSVSGLAAQSVTISHALEKGASS